MGVDMNFKDQSSSVWGETPTDKEEAILWIERAGRTCYRSEDKIVEGSGKTFVENIWKRKHYSVIEHSNLVLRSREKFNFPLLALQRIKSIFESKFLYFCIKENRVYVGGNWRAWIDFYNRIKDDFDEDITLDNITTIFVNNEFETVIENIPNELKIISAEFITDRAVMAEITRHRIASLSVESQRYCRYDNIDFIYPHWYDNVSSDMQDSFEFMCLDIEEEYSYMLKNGLKAEEARAILPNCTATKIVMSASIPEWKHVFNLRLSKAAYPQIRKLLQPVRDEFVQKGWIK